ncbi:multidrug effflux MFS transporter [Pantoea sp. 1.19]|uniref:multidrug effflux MFS transporter n=1 Tax=Pantoea sp. 1.19 TaxID=1925589 RepID=UPI000949096D|nr:multidrug effflux MFS transporter [Pantoea sp. 1.19]
MTASTPHRLGFAIVLGLLAGLGPLCIDLYLPALPALTADLHTVTATAQLSLTAGLAGIGLGQLLFGPLSDKYGRLRPLLASLLLFLLASLACGLAQNIEQLLLARLLQGMFGAGGAVLSRAMARDTYSGHDLTKFFALLMLVNGLAPILAPVLGGALLTFLSWRGLFAALSLIALALLLMACRFLRESLPAPRRRQGSLLSTWAGLGPVLASRTFMGFCLTQGCAMAGMFAYIGASPFVLQLIYGLSPQAFSYCFAANGAGLIIGSQAGSRLSGLWGEYRVLRGALWLALSAAAALLLTALLAAPLPLVLLALFCAIGSLGAIAVNASSLAMQSQGERAGSASALIGVTGFTLGGVAVPLTSLGGTSLLSMSLTLFGCYLLAMLTFRLLARQPTGA